MYIWIAADVDGELCELRRAREQAAARLACNDPALTLPLHISLKISFKAPSGREAEIIEEVCRYLSSIRPFEAEPLGLEEENGILWLKMNGSAELAALHSHLDGMLLDKFGIEQHPFDKEFKFHTTLFFSSDLCALREVLDVPELLRRVTVRRFIIGVSESGRAGSYSIDRYVDILP